jgi:hypothetical protein
MKIGILTYHRSHNYGALLQAIALRNVLADMGHQVTYIDYWPNYQQHRYLLFSWKWMMTTQKGILGKIRYIRNCVRNCKYRRRRIKVFNAFISEYIQPYLSSCCDSYDIIIYGSDQVWRKQPEINTYDPIYFGKYDIKAVKRISYAVSMGFLPDNDKDIEVLKDNMSYLNAISVREKNLADFVAKLGYSKVRQDLDPTLLMTSVRWKKLFKICNCNNSYVFYYKLKDTFDINKVNAFAKKHDLDIKIISGRDRPGRRIDNIEDPRSFLELLSNSSYVFTSSFHGLVFALLFHKPFYASFNKIDRAYSLLSSLGLLNRLMAPKDDIPSESVPIDYNLVDKKLDMMRKESLHFLYEQCSEKK